MAQLSRRLRIRLQQAATDGPADGRDWRPSIVTVRTDTFEAPHDVILLLGWLSSRYGFGTYLHHLVRPLDRASYAESQRLRPDLVDLCEVESPGVFAETVVSPSREDALAHALQLPGGTGASPNTVLFDFAPDAGPADLRELLDEARFGAATGKSLLLLRRSADDERAAFGRRRHLHVWIDERDGDNAALMVLLAFILVGHPTWRKAHVSVSVAFPEEGHEVERERIVRTLTEGRLPIRQENIRFVPAGAAPEAGADLLLLGLDGPTLAGHEAQLVAHPELPSVLFVRAAERISIE